MNIVLFEDQAVPRLAPLAILRPMFAVPCGSLTLANLALGLSNTVRGMVRPHLRSTVGDFLPQSELDEKQPTLYLNARLIPDAGILRHLQAICDASKPVRIKEGADVLVAWLPPGARLAGGGQELAGKLNEADLPDQSADDRFSLFGRAHELVTEHRGALLANLEHRLTWGSYEEIADGVFVNGDVKLSSQPAWNTEDGPILIETGVSIEPFCVIHGPTHLGAHTKVLPHSFLKGKLAIGVGCKVGGEISQSTMDDYSNKCHFGYLGAAHIGRWVNLGAGTTNSNLKNTYGTVRVEYEDQKIDSGEQFLGCVIGDFTKTAIHTSIYTGKLVGICSNVYGVVTKNVPSFANYAASLGDVSEHGPDVAVVTQRRVFARRGIQQREQDIQLIHDAYALESPKRHLVDQPPSI